MAWDSYGKSRYDGSPSTLDDYRAALARLEAMDLIYPGFESRAEIARLVAAREGMDLGRAIPTARHFIPAVRRIYRQLSESGALMRVSPTH